MCAPNCDFPSRNPLSQVSTNEAPHSGDPATSDDCTGPQNPSASHHPLADADPKLQGLGSSVPKSEWPNLQVRLRSSSFDCHLSDLSTTSLPSASPAFTSVRSPPHRREPLPPLRCVSANLLGRRRESVSPPNGILSVPSPWKILGVGYPPPPNTNNRQSQQGRQPPQLPNINN